MYWFILTQPVINPYNEEILYPAGYMITNREIKALKTKYGVDNLEGVLALTGDAADHIVGEIKAMDTIAGFRKAMLKLLGTH